MRVRSLLVAVSLLVATSPVAAMSPAVGESVSDTRFTTAYGQSLSMSDLRGEVVVITYWMRDCKPCQEQLKALDYYYRQRRHLGFRVLAIAPEEMSDSELRRAFKDKIIHPIARLEGPFEPMGALPTTYIVDRNGQVRYAASGAMGIEQLNQILIPLLRQPQP